MFAATKATAKAWCLRPYTVLVALLLGFVGIRDIVGSVPFPPETGEFIPPVVFHTAGVFLLVGALALLGALALRGKVLGLRVERAAHMMLAGTGAVMTLLYAHPAWVSHISSGGQVGTYVAVSWAGVTLAALARWYACGKLLDGEWTYHLGCGGQDESR